VSAKTDPRALAAQALQRIAGGESLRVAFGAAAPQLPDSRDRALLSALLHAGARWWIRFDAALDDLLERPLRGKTPDVHALLVLGLVQIEILRLAPYAAVAATVEAVRTLKKPQLAGLTNAVLRRWLRERDARNAALDRVPATQSAHPPWLIEALARDWPPALDAILAANNAEAPLTLRVNRRRIARDAYLDTLLAAGIGASAHAQLPDAVLLDDGSDVTALPGYAEGWFSVQDGAAQLAAPLLDVRDGLRVLDACAAPGGKSAHLLETAQLDLVALDNEAPRLERVRTNLARLGFSADLRRGDAAQPQTWWDGKPFDRILLDAPCSATGVIRRQPDIKLHRRAADIARLAATQRTLLDALWPLLAPGGRLVYATCSVLAAENSAVLGDWLSAHADAEARVPAELQDWHAAGAGRQNLPGENGMDGFFYAVVEKRN
jgi:16S rRNA (cytosine967-C5)-methyltransferase